MTLETFFEKFELFADAPDAVAKMRELILNFAVSGRLHASESPLNGRIASLGEVIKLISGQHLTPDQWNKSEKGIPYLTGPSDFGRRVTIITRWTLKPKTVAKKGDVLLTVKGSGVGKTNLLDIEEAAIGRQIMAIRAISVHPSFIDLVLQSAKQTFQDMKQGIAIPGISRSDVLNLQMFLPPLAEQKRIVAKVDELMALCDSLEAQQQESEEQASALARASLARFGQAPTPANLNLLFHKSYSISPADLRKAILAMAVHGKLVSRISPEGTGSEILYRSEVEACVVDDGPQLPEHWTWARLGSVTTLMNSGWSPACESTPAPKGSWGVLKTTAVQSLQYLEGQNKSLPPALKPRPENEVMDGDILFTRAGPMNRVGVLCVARPTRKKLMLSDKIVRFHLINGIDPDFAALAMTSGYPNSCIEELKSGMAASQVNISQPKLRSVPIPIPPLAEQRRIVAKVDHLMALVDELETQLAASRATAKSLLEALVAELT